MSTALHERDFYGWLEHTAQLVREGRFDEIDRDILIDELESMGKRDERELGNRLIILIAHLLKRRFQPDAQDSSWTGSIAEQRLQINGLLEDSPSLRNLVPDAVARAYPKAVALAARETRLPSASSPPHVSVLQRPAARRGLHASLSCPSRDSPRPGGETGLAAHRPYRVRYRCPR